MARIVRRRWIIRDTNTTDQFHFDPVTYLKTIRAEVPAYDELQDAVAKATAGIHAERVLELGVGTGETSRRIVDLHPEAALVGIDKSAEMLATASLDVAADLRLSRLEDPLPEGNFDLVVSALAVHHLDGAGKAKLFARVAGRLRLGGRFVTTRSGGLRQPASTSRWFGRTRTSP
jgi:tRNA (cmo5U34)-methyltransferase